MMKLPFRGGRLRLGYAVPTPHRWMMNPVRTTTAFESVADEPGIVLPGHCGFVAGCRHLFSNIRSLAVANRRSIIISGAGRMVVRAVDVRTLWPDSSIRSPRRVVGCC